MSESLGTAVLELDADASPLDRKIDMEEARVQGRIAAMSAKMRAAGGSMVAAGRGLTRNLTMPILAVAGAAGKFAYDFDKSMTNIKALVGASDKQIDQYRKTILHMAQTGKGSANDLARALYFITSSGFSGAKALDVLDASATAAGAGLGDVQQVANLVTSAIKVYGEKNLTAAKAVDVLTAAVREGKAEPAEFAQNMGRVLPVAEKLGVGFGELSGVVASLTLGGLDAAEATTALRAAMLAAFNPTKEAKDALASIGMTSDQLRDKISKRGLLKSLVDLNDAFHGNTEAMGAVFGNVRGLVGALSLAGKSSKEYARLIRRVAGANGDASKSFDEASQSVSKRFHDSINRLQALLIIFGSMVLPYVASALSTLTGAVAAAVSWFQSLSPWMQKLILIGLAVAVALGPTLLVIGKLTQAVGLLGSALTFLAANPVVLVIAAIAALAAAVAAAVLWPDKLSTVLQRMGFSADQAARIIATLQQVFETVKQAAQTFVAVVSALWDRFGVHIVAQAQAVWEFLKQYVAGAMMVIKGIIDIVAGLIQGDWSRVWKGIKEVFGGVWQGIVAEARFLLATLGNVVRAALASVVATFSAFWRLLRSAAVALGEGIKDGLWSELSKLASVVGAAFAAVWGWLVSAVGTAYGFAAGIGRAIAQGVMDGINSLKDQVLSAIQWLIDKIKYILSFKWASPPDEFGHKVGAALISGLAAGIIAQMGLAADASAKVVQAVKARLRDLATGVQAQFRTMFVLPGPSPGLLVPGNLDLLHRQIARIGKDIATVRSISVSTNLGETLIPSVIEGRVVSLTAAIEHFKRTGENLGTFKSIADANAYAERLHNQQAAFYGAGKDLVSGLSQGIAAGSAETQTAATRVVQQALAITRLIVSAGGMIGFEHAAAIARGIVQGSPGIVAQVRSALAQAVEAARQKVVESKAAIASAFSALAQAAFDAFDAKAAAWKPPAQRLLEKMQLEDQIEQAKRAIEAAQAQLDAAQQAVATAAPQEGETPEAFQTRMAQLQQDVVTATRGLGDAKRAQVELNLQLEATQQQTAHDERVRKQREQLAGQLIALQTELKKHPEEWDKIQKKIQLILAAYDVPMFNAGQRLASKFADGLRDKLGDVQAAVQALANATSAITGGTGGGTSGGGGASRPPDRRASGGPVTAGRPYLVGERGLPEIFVPNVSGTITPTAHISTSDSTGVNPATPIVIRIGDRDFARFTLAELLQLKRVEGSLGLA